MYRQTCDGSAAVALDREHFLDLNDEDQGIAVFRRGVTGAPVFRLEISGELGMAPTDEADLEDAARIGERVYVISSHGRNKHGSLRTERYRFFAIDLAGVLPDLETKVTGPSSRLLADMLDPGNWTSPSPTTIAALVASSRLDRQKVPHLAPKDAGTNIEGLAWYPSAANPHRLAIGFRNPRPGAKALIVTLLDPDEVIAGRPAHFGEAISLDLDGLGIRGMTWSAADDRMLILAGPSHAEGPFRLYTWSGKPGSPALLARDLVLPPDATPEAIVTYPDTKDVAILLDMGNARIDGVRCKDLPIEDRSFDDMVVRVN